MASEQPAPGGRFGKYLIERRLGTGGMADVYVAVLEGPRGFEKAVALKRMRCDPASRSDFEQRFVREARVAAMLQHPNIGQVFDFGSVDDELYIAMELIDGVDLGDLLNAASGANEEVPLGVAVAIGIDLMSALEFAHGASSPDGTPLELVHRDVSPSNVLVSYSGHAKLIDFGITRVADDVPTTQTGQIVGKFRYMSPEQVQGEPLDGRSDVFAAGVVLWEVIARRRLFAGANTAAVIQEIVGKPIERPSTHRDLSPELDDILMKCLARERADRYGSAGQVRAALEALARHDRLDTSADAVARFVQAVAPRTSVASRDVVDVSATAPLRKPRQPETSATVSERPARMSMPRPAAQSEPARDIERAPASAKWWWGPAATLGVVVAATLVWYGLLREPAERAAGAGSARAPAPASSSESPVALPAPAQAPDAAPVAAPVAMVPPDAAARVAETAAKRTPRKPVERPVPVDDGSIAYELDIDSNPTGAEVVLEQQGSAAGAARRTPLCTTPCRRSIRVPENRRFWVSLRRDGCDGGSAQVIAGKGPRALVWRIDLEPKAGAACVRDRHTTKSVSRQLRKLRIAPCFAPDNISAYRAELTVAEDGAVRSVDVALVGDGDARKSDIESCIAGHIRQTALIPAREPATVRVHLGR